MTHAALVIPLLDGDDGWQLSTNAYVTFTECRSWPMCSFRVLTHHPLPTLDQVHELIGEFLRQRGFEHAQAVIDGETP